MPTGEKELEKAKAKLQVAAYCIEMTCDATNRGIIDRKNEASDMYKALRDHYEGDTPAKRMDLRRSLYRLEHDTSVPVIQFINNIRSIVTDLAAISHEPKPDEIRDIVLMNLHSSFEVIRTILASQDKNGSQDWTLDALSNQLTAFEANRAAHGEVTFSSIGPASAFAAHGRHSSSQQRSHRPRTGDNWGNTRNIPGACDRCGHLGHDSSRCFRDMPEHVKDRLRHHKESANVATSSSPPLGPLTIAGLRSTLNSGHTVSLFSDNGIIEKGDEIVGKINYTPNGFNVEDYYIKASYAFAECGVPYS